MHKIEQAPAYKEALAVKYSKITDHTENKVTQLLFDCVGSESGGRQRKIVWHLLSLNKSLVYVNFSKSLEHQHSASILDLAKEDLIEENMDFAQIIDQLYEDQTKAISNFNKNRVANE